MIWNRYLRNYLNFAGVPEEVAQYFNNLELRQRSHDAGEKGVDPTAMLVANSVALAPAVVTVRDLVQR